MKFFKEIIKDPVYQFGFLSGFVIGIGMIIIGAAMAHV